jgi:anti-sigma regulatory factor (Ser/Thr protein kinase)
MLRAVQEIVTNSIRHGEAGNLWITIERLPAKRGRRAKELIATSGGLTLVTNCMMRIAP